MVHEYLELSFFFPSVKSISYTITSLSFPSKIIATVENIFYRIFETIVIPTKDFKRILIRAMKSTIATTF